MDLVAFALSKKYTNDTADALGAVKGSPCTIKSAVHQNGRTTITFEWKGYSGQTEETQITVLDGTPIYEWQSGDQYNYSDLVIYASCFYRCITPNSDIEFDDTKWNEIGSPDGNYDIVQNSSLLPSIFTSADRKMYYSIEDQYFYLWNGTQWAAQKSAASDVIYDNTNSGLESENVQGAIDEVYGGLGTASSKDVAASGDASATEVVMGNDSRLTDARTPVAHAHTVSDITDFPASMPASDVYNWAKQENKPTYTANEVGAIPAIDKGSNGGVAELDSNGKIPSSQLPSYVDDVVEGYYDSQTDRFYEESTFETVIPPESGKVWVDITTNKSYRWTGSVYTRVDEGVQLGETSSTAYRGDRGKTAYDHSQVTSGNPHNVTKSDVGLGNVGNFKAVSTEASQGLTSTEQENARANIGAGTSSFDGAYSSLTGTPTLGTASAKDVAASGDASTTQVVMGNDSRLTDSRNAADVYSWAKAENKPNYTATEVGAVATTANQDLTSTEQANARDNIGLGSASVKNVSASGDAGTTEVVLGNDSRLTDARTPVSHTHTVSEISDFPSSMPASDVSAWAKEPTKPTYTASEVGAVATTSVGSASGVAELDANGKVPSSQLPSYVDDVIEGYLYEGNFYEDAQHTEQITGEASKIYIDLTTDSTYRWGGSAFSPVGSSLALGETSTTAYRGDRGKAAYDHSQLTSGNPHNVTKSDVGLGNVGNFKAVSTEANQGLTSTEQSNARANIGAGTSNFDGAYSSLTGTPTLGAAAAKGVVTTLDSSNDLPTSAAVKTYVDASSGGSTAADITYDNTDSGMTATNVQDAVDELSAGKANGEGLTFFIQNGILYMDDGVPPLEIVPFSTGTDAQIKAMLDAYYNDEITWEEMGWQVGNTRTIHLNSMSAPYNEYGQTTWDAQDIRIVIIDHDKTDLATPINGHTKACITVQTREVMNDVLDSYDSYGLISTNDGELGVFRKWSQLTMRTFLNNRVWNAFSSSTFKEAIKSSKRYCHTSYDTSSSELVEDKLFLPSYAEVFGTASYANYVPTSPVEGTQFAYYQSSNHRIKCGNGNGSSNFTEVYWWLGSPSSALDDDDLFCWLTVTNEGTVDFESPFVFHPLAPAWAM